MIEFINHTNHTPAQTDADPATNDDALLVEAAQRDRTAFAPLYRRYVTPVYRYLYSRTGNQAEAEDLTAVVFTEALEKLGRYREQGHFAAWLFTIAQRRLIDLYRRNQRPLLPLNEALDKPTEGRDLPAQIAHCQRLEQLATLLEQLDEEKQELLRLRFAGELTYQEIGQTTGRSEAAAKMTIHRLLRQLEAEWEECHD